MNVRKYCIHFLMLLYVFLISSCSNDSGKIEKRKDGNIYLVNTSSSEPYKFTIKRTEIRNGSSESYSTQIINLEAGDEVSLGQEEFNSEKIFPIIKKRIQKTYDYSPTSEPVKVAHNSKRGTAEDLQRLIDQKKFEENIELSTFPDTIIEGKRYKYNFEIISQSDSLHPYPQDHFKNKYQITAAVKTKHT